MPIAVPATRQTLADAYKNLGSWISLHTGDPGATGDHEARGGTPPYARQQTTWTSSTGGIINGLQVAFDVPAGTYTYAGLWKTANGGATDFVDKVAITPTTLGDQGQILVTPSFTQS
ncbi:hypothetical protein [Nocardia transvalensis]|uniref:phage tail fiber protein n=1 Tax=Nocardia transvalensis TaxID=37333 RepID=UPI001895AC55|nr:hypothetical protein [Nocardia transvalensis]MBF6328718.1 hypothetical protein [Nocardia transvalensis]